MYRTGIARSSPWSICNKIKLPLICRKEIVANTIIMMKGLLRNWKVKYKQLRWPWSYSFNNSRFWTKYFEFLTLLGWPRRKVKLDHFVQKILSNDFIGLKMDRIKLQFFVFATIFSLFSIKIRTNNFTMFYYRDIVQRFKKLKKIFVNWIWYESQFLWLCRLQHNKRQKFSHINNCLKK